MHKLLQFFFLLLIFIVWEILSLDNKFSFVFGAPTEIFKKIYENTLSLNFPYHAIITLSEATVGFLIGTILGIIFGFIIWSVPILGTIFRPYLFLMSIVPVFAFAPIVIVWFGIGFWMKVFLAGFASFIIATTNIIEGANSINKREIDFFKLMGANKFQIVSKLIFPSSILFIFISMRANISVALMGAFIGEFLSSNEGIASEMIKAGSLYDVNTVFAATTYLILIAIVLHVFIKLIETKKNFLISCLSIQHKLIKLKG